MLLRFTNFLLRRWDELGDGLEYGLYFADQYFLIPLEKLIDFFFEDPMALVQAFLILAAIVFIIYV